VAKRSLLGHTSLPLSMDADKLSEGLSTPVSSFRPNASNRVSENLSLPDVRSQYVVKGFRVVDSSRRRQGVLKLKGMTGAHKRWK